MGFSEQLKKARKNAGYTQQQVAEAIGITNSAYCAYEIGKRHPDVEKITQLADFLGVSSDYLLDRQEMIWQDAGIMNNVDEGFATLFNILGQSLNKADPFERKMFYDTLVELRHCMSLIEHEKKKADAALSLVQRSLACSGRFMDACTSAKAEPEVEQTRLERAKEIAARDYMAALDEALQILNNALQTNP